jgi:hypothetical protein
MVCGIRCGCGCSDIANSPPTRGAFPTRRVSMHRTRTPSALISHDNHRGSVTLRTYHSRRTPVSLKTRAKPPDDAQLMWRTALPVNSRSMSRRATVPISSRPASTATCGRSFFAAIRSASSARPMRSPRQTCAEGFETEPWPSSRGSEAHVRRSAISTARSGRRSPPGPSSPRRQRPPRLGTEAGSKTAALLTGDRGIESCSLHRRVGCEPELRNFRHRCSGTTTAATVVGTEDPSAAALVSSRPTLLGSLRVGAHRLCAAAFNAA